MGYKSKHLLANEWYGTKLASDFVRHQLKGPSEVPIHVAMMDKDAMTQYQKDWDDWHFEFKKYQYELSKIKRQYYKI